MQDVIKNINFISNIVAGSSKNRSGYKVVKKIKKFFRILCEIIQDKSNKLLNDSWGYNQKIKCL